MLAWARPTASENEGGCFLGMVFHKYAALLELRMGTRSGGVEGRPWLAGGKAEKIPGGCLDAAGTEALPDGQCALSRGWRREWRRGSRTRLAGVRGLP